MDIKNALVCVIFFANQYADVNLIIYLWPLIIIFVGIAFLFTKGKHKRKAVSDDADNTFALFSGVQLDSHSENYKGGQVTAIFGEADIDLGDILIQEKVAELELTAILAALK